MKTQRTREMIDLRSDTVSRPGPELTEGIELNALNVDGFGEDLHTRELEETAAAMVGKERALLFPTGIMANLAAVIAHTPPRHEVIVGRTSHIFSHEAGGVSIFGGIPMKTVSDPHGLPEVEELRNSIGNGRFNSTRTGLVALENPHNDAAGIAHRPEAVRTVADIPRNMGIPVHLDGARLFNACARFDLPCDAYADCADSIMLCLNKGLAAPIGALLLGDQAFIERAAEIRKSLGGELCQPGMIAQIALRSLATALAHAHTDNANAARLCELLGEHPRLTVKPLRDGTNIVYIYLRQPHRPAMSYLDAFTERGVQLLANEVAFRAVFHRGISSADVRRIAEVFSEVICTMSDVVQAD